MNMQATIIKQTEDTYLAICYMLLHIPVPSETFVINEIIALQSLGVDIHTVSLWPSQECHEELMVLINNPIYSLSDDAIQQTASNSLYYPHACKLASNYNISQNLAAQAALAAEYTLACAINHIHAHFATEAALVALLVSKMTGVPYTFTAHAYDIFRLNVSGECDPGRRLGLLVENSTKTITISEFNRKHILSVTDQALERKIEVVHCGIDLERFKPIEREAADCVTFLSVGRLVEKKGHEFLLRSLRKVFDATGDVRLRIVGEGELRSTLTALADELGLADRVTFVGAVSSDVVLNEMQNADVFVLHSLTGSDGDREGIPVSIMEACATGLPVVSTRHSGIPELVIEGVNGFLVDERDYVGFAEAMRILALSPKLRAKMGLAGHSFVAENFNLHRETQKLKNIFAAVIAESSARPSNVVQVSDTADAVSACRPNSNLLKRILDSIANRVFR